MLPLYRFSLRTPPGQFYALVGDIITGDVYTRVNPFYLPAAPDGWRNTAVEDIRNLKYMGMERSVSTEYQFVVEGAKILRDIWYKNKRKAECILWIEILNRTTQQYELWHKGYLDFSTDSVKDEWDYFQTRIIDGGLAALIKSKESQDHEIWLNYNHTHVVNVKVPPFLVKGKLQFMSAWPVPIQGDDPEAIDTAFGWLPFYIFLDKTVIASREGYDPVTLANTKTDIDNGAAVSNVGIVGQLPAQAFNQEIFYDDNYLFKATRDLKNVNFKGFLEVYLDNADGDANTTFNLKVIKVKPGNVVVNLHAESINVAQGAAATHQFSLDIGAYTVSSGEIVKIWINKVGGNQYFRVKWSHKTELIVTFENYTDEFHFAAMKYHQAWKELIMAVTDSQATGISNLLTTTISAATNADLKPTNMVVTSTSAICGITKPTFGNQAYPTFKTNISDMFRDVNCWQGASMIVDEAAAAVRLERRRDVFDNTQVVCHISNPASFKVYPATEFMYDKVKIGCANQTYDGVNGLKEFNTTQNWDLCRDFKLTTNKELDLTTPYRYDMYGVLFTWMNNVLINKDGNYNSGTNSASKDDMFVLYISDVQNDDGSYSLQTWNPTNSLVQGIELDNTGNIPLSPSRCMKRNGSLLHAVAQGLETDYIKYVTQDKNNELYSILTSVPFDEDRDVQVALIGNPLFGPQIIEVECQSPDDFLILTENTPFGKHTIEWNGYTYEGFPLTRSKMPTDPEPSYRWTFLATPTCNFQNLIH